MPLDALPRTIPESPLRTVIAVFGTFQVARNCTLLRMFLVSETRNSDTAGSKWGGLQQTLQHCGRFVSTVRATHLSGHSVSIRSRECYSKGWHSKRGIAMILTTVFDVPISFSVRRIGPLFWVSPINRNLITRHCFFFQNYAFFQKSLWQKLLLLCVLQTNERTRRSKTPRIFELQRKLNPNDCLLQDCIIIWCRDPTRTNSPLP